MNRLKFLHLIVCLLIIFSSSVKAIGALPNAVNDTAITEKKRTGTTIEKTSLDVLANDHHGDAPAAITNVSNPSNGTATINKDKNRIFYVPNTNFMGTDTFTYTITDNDGDTSTGTVTITHVYKIGIDPGHGGTDGGATYDMEGTHNIPPPKGLREADIALSTAFFVRGYLYCFYIWTLT